MGTRGWDEDLSIRVYNIDRPFAWLALPEVMSGMRNISDLIYILIVCWSCEAISKASMMAPYYLTRAMMVTKQAT